MSTGFAGSPLAYRLGSVATPGSQGGGGGWWDTPGPAPLGYEGTGPGRTLRAIFIIIPVGIN